MSPQELEIINLSLGIKIVDSERYPFELTTRTPVVTVMGHVDHGKTTLLDHIRSSNIAEAEIGGITQRIGGFIVEHELGKTSFIDTPGHAIFKNMRETGALVTDAVVLIVSAVEGVQPQTKEVIDLIARHQLPCFVAVNKIDSEGADFEAVLEQLVNEGIEIEEYGGNVFAAGISAKTGSQVDLFHQMIVEECAALDIQGWELTSAECLVVESRASLDTLSKDAITELTKKSQIENDKGICSIVVKNGILQPGQHLIFGRGRAMAKVSQIKNEKGHFLESAGPGQIVELVGLSELPKAGEILQTVSSDSTAKKILAIAKKFLDKAKLEKISGEEEVDVRLPPLKTRRRKRKFYASSKNMIKSIDEHKETLRVSMLLESDEEVKQRLKNQIEQLEIMKLELSGGEDMPNPVIIKVSIIPFQPYSANMLLINS